jgi:hypothetical protein
MVFAMIAGVKQEFKRILSEREVCVLLFLYLWGETKEQLK